MPDHPIVSIGQYSIAGRKPRNDDSYGVMIPRPPLLASKGLAMAIADGMSSSEGAKEASETCIRSFLDDYYCTPESWSVKTSAARVLTAINRWLHAQSMRQFDSDKGLVTTFTGAIVKGGQAHIFHVGDCRVSLVRGTSIERLTDDHRIKVARGQDFLARAVGIGPDLDVDYRVASLEPGDCLIFTCDGVHDHVAERQLLATVRDASDDLDGAAKGLVDMAYANGSVDNLTCQIVRIDHPGTPDRKARLDRLSTLPFPPELEVGSRIDGYSIVRELHASPRSQVYLAEDAETGMTVVLKTPSTNHSDNADYIERFSREEWVGRLVQSPHVLKMLEPVRPRHYLYLISEHIEGRTLAQWIVDQPRPDIATVRVVVVEIARGLQALHRKEIIHQDLKPDNVLITQAGVAKIIDFGSVRVAGLGDTRDLSEKLGTVDYSAPEFLTGQAIDARADIYSLGVIAYEMLSGHHPYGRGFGSVADVRRAAYRPLRLVEPGIPGWVDAAIARAVAIDPRQRYDALSAFVADLTRPNPDLVPISFKPLLERNPVVFWRTAFFVTAAIAAMLALRLLMR